MFGVSAGCTMALARLSFTAMTQSVAGILPQRRTVSSSCQCGPLLLFSVVFLRQGLSMCSFC